MGDEDHIRRSVVYLLGMHGQLYNYIWVMQESKTAYGIAYDGIAWHGVNLDIGCKRTAGTKNVENFLVTQSSLFLGRDLNVQLFDKLNSYRYLD
jgi:hypothetical protein